MTSQTVQTDAEFIVMNSGDFLPEARAEYHASQAEASGSAGIRAHAALPHQVAGHAGVMADESGQMVIKPALPREVAFYQLIFSQRENAPLRAIKPFLPKYYGTLSLLGHIDQLADNAAPVPSAAPESIVLENLVSPYSHPCVLDAKLGIVLHAPDATPEKAARMEKKARESTVAEKGMRLTGCQTWHEPSQSFIITPRAFGYDITAERLPEGLVRFFPLPTDELVFMSDGEVQDKVKGKDSKPELVTDSSKVYKDHVIPARLTYRLLETLEERIAALAETWARFEIRAVGASLLVVYEGDADRLAASFAYADAKRVSDAARALAGDDEDVDEEDEDDFPNGEDLSESETDEDSEDDGVKADARRAARVPPITVRMIDFAHTWLAEGEGPDEGVLKGLATLRDLVAIRKRQVEEWMEKYEPQSPSKVAQGFGSEQ